MEMRFQCDASLNRGTIRFSSDFGSDIARNEPPLDAGRQTLGACLIRHGGRAWILWERLNPAFCLM